MAHVGKGYAGIFGIASNVEGYNFWNNTFFAREGFTGPTDPRVLPVTFEAMFQTLPARTFYPTNIAANNALLVNRAYEILLGVSVSGAAAGSELAKGRDFWIARLNASDASGDPLKFGNFFTGFLNSIEIVGNELNNGTRTTTGDAALDAGAKAFPFKIQIANFTGLTGATGGNVTTGDLNELKAIVDRVNSQATLDQTRADVAANIAAGGDGSGVGAGAGVPGQTFTLTATADDFSPNSQAPNSKTTDGNDTFLAGSVQGGGAHTLGAADNIDGSAGTDTIKIVEDRAPAAGNTLFPRMSNVENVEIQALTAAAVDFTNTTGVQRLVSDRSITPVNVNSPAVTVTNLRDDATLVLSNTSSRLSVDYAANATLDAIARIELANAGAAAGVDFATPGAQENAITTLNLKVDGTPTTLSTASITGLNGTGALVNVVLSGNANTTFNGNMAADDLDPNTNGNQPALFKDVTSINATALTGTLTLSMLGDQANVADRNITFQGGNGNTRLTVGQGNNNVTLGSGNDLLILSSSGFNAMDSLNGGAGTDELEIHFNDTVSAQAGTAVNGVTPNGLDDATDAVVVAVNAAQNFETLVVDVWNQGGAASNVIAAANNAESVNLKADLFNATNFAFQDTFQDGNAAGAGTVDADISGSIVVTGVRNANTFTLRSDVTNVADFTAAAGNNTLNVTVAGADATNSANAAVTAPVTVASAGTSNLADNDSVALLRAAGLSNVNVTLNNVDNATTTAVNEAGTATLTEVRVDDNATVRLTGSVLAVSATINSRDVQEALTGNTAAFGATLDASGLTTIADRDAATVAAGVAPGVNRANELAVNQGQNVTIIGTAQDDNITGSNGNDVLTAGSGDDVVNTLDGDDTVTTGDGNDVVNAGSGVKNISTGAGDDRVVFTNTSGDNLTSADIVDGGAGRDTVAVANQSLLGDAVFNQITNVENIELANGTFAVLNAIANARSFDTVSAAAGASINLNLQEGFSRNLTVNLSNGNDIVNATTAPGAVTVNANAANINGNDSITGGTSANDALVLTADNGTANLSGLRNVETVRLVSDANTVTGVEDITVVIGNDAAIAAPAAAGQTRTLTIDGSTLASRPGNTAGDRPDVTIDGSAVNGAGKLLNITTAAGFDNVIGGANADTINTGAGNDIIVGAGGADALTGGAGVDLFRYLALGDSSGTTVDSIADFVSGAMGDRIQVSTALTGATPLRFAGNQANFGSAQGATIQGGDIDYVFQADTNTLWVDINNDGTLNANDLQIRLNGVTAIAAGDVVAVNLNAPTINSVTGNDLVNATEANAFNITGTGAAGATVTVAFDSGRVLAGGNTAVVAANGTWTLAVAAADVAAFGQGGETITAFQTLTDGTVSVNSTRTFNVDTVVPVATIDLADASDSGAANTDNLTNVQSVTINGTAEAGSTVVISGGAANATVTAGALGTYTATVNLNTNTVNNLSAVATDAAGNASTAATLAVTHDNTAPAAPAFTIADNVGAIQGNVAANGRTDDNTLTLNGTVAAVNPSDRGTVTVFANGIQVGTAAVDQGTGAWTLTTPTLTDGTLTFTTTLTDRAGNTTATAAAPVAVTVDTTAPTQPTLLLAGSTGIQNNTLNAGDTVTVTATFGGVNNGDALVVDTAGGTPSLGISINGTIVQALYNPAASNLNTGVLGFTYTILPGQTDPNGISIPNNAIQLNGGTIRDTAGNNAVIASVAVADNANFRVDTTAPTPTITAVDFTNVGTSNNFGLLTITGSGFGTGVTNGGLDSLNLANMSFGAINLNGVLNVNGDMAVNSTIVSHTDTTIQIRFNDDGFVAAAGRFTDAAPETLVANAGAFVDAAGNASQAAATGSGNAALVAANISSAVANSGQITNSVTLVGQDKADTLVGDGVNANTFTGGGGNDTMTAVNGAVVDTFVFSAAATNGVDTINSFDVANDVLNLTAAAATPGTGVVTIQLNERAVFGDLVNDVGQGGINGGQALSQDVYKFAANVASLTDLSVVAAFLNSDVNGTPGNPRAQVVADGVPGNAAAFLLIDNGGSTGVYLFSDDAVVNNTIEAGELTHLATLVGVADATTVANFMTA